MSLDRDNLTSNRLSEDGDSQQIPFDARMESPNVPAVRPEVPAAPVPSPRGNAGRGERRGEDSNDSSDIELDRTGPRLQEGGGAPETRTQLPPPGGLYRQGGEPGRRQDGCVNYPVSADHGHGRGDGQSASRRDDNMWLKEALPPTAEHEIEVIIKDATTFTAGQATRSPSKTVGNFRFRILVFPSGTHSTGGHQVSAFVEADPVEGLDPRWVFHGVKYQITLVNWLDYRKSVTKSDTWTFSKDGIDRGWHDMVRTAELVQSSGWLGPDNSLCLRASCLVRQADGVNVSSDYNFKKETGYIGLKNHGATCYMNGLLQSLFHVGEFRKIVYSIDCDEGSGCPGKDDPPDMGKGSDGDPEGRAPPLIQALQNVFYKLQTSDQPVNCRELMKSFGWDTMDAFTQHDAQELNRILCDRLEEQMKGSPSDGSIKRLFEGEMENYIECIEVDYKSKRNETFYDIQLNIKGERGQELRNIEESLRDFTTEETLEGDNAYEAEGHGKQRAKKGIRFLTFPPVLNLQLKRFHFDLEKMDMVKLNSRFEFHRKLDLSSFAPGAGSYLLYAVVVHSGDVNSGHYYAHIRPSLEQGWFKFDDDTVTPCSEYAAVEDNYGGNDLAVYNYFDRSPRALRGAQPPARPRIHNAYMLVYIREDCADQILRPPDPKLTNLKMVERCDREVRLAEQRRREKMEQQLKIRIKLVFDKDLVRMSGFWDHADIPHSNTLKMGRDQNVKDLSAEIEDLVKVPRNHMVLFSLQYRNNPRQVRFAFMPPTTTFRSHIPQCNAPHFDTSDPFLVVLCVMSKGYDVQTLKWNPPTEDTKPVELMRWHDDQVTLLIVKYFCPQTRRIVTLGSRYTPNTEPLIGMVNDGWVAERLKPHLANKEVAPLQDDQDIWECWEEFSERDIQPRNVKRTVKNEQLWSGDVIIWQPAVPAARQGDGSEGGTGEATPGGEGDGDVAPMYPVNTVADLAAHISNSVDVVVTLHDARQPLCVDGVVSNGFWGPPRPQSAAKETSPAKEERPEDVALASSPARFNPPQEKEMKMDLRWHLHHVTGTIARAFSLKPQVGEAQLWLFHAAPSSTMEEPLNAYPSRDQQTTLKDIQRTTSYLSTPAKRQFNLHAVELPFQPSRQVYDRGLCPLCVRFYNDAVVEVGSQLITVQSHGTVNDVLNEARKHLLPEYHVTGQLRALEVADSRLHKLYRPEAPVRSLACFNKPNIFYHCLRVEADPEAGSTQEGHKLIEIFHCDRQSQQAFAQPLLLYAAPGEKAGSIKNRCKVRLRVPDAEFKSWRLVRCGRTGKAHLKDEEAWDSDNLPDARICLEHVHPNPTSSLARYNKPLTIKG